MDDLDLSCEVSISVEYVDEHLIELECLVRTGLWQGRTCAYTVASQVAAFAESLLRFADGGPLAEFEAGEDNGIGLIELRFYRIDRSGHIAGHARLASGRLPTDHRPEQVARLEAEFMAEVWAVGQFARQLAELARTQSGRASLAIEQNA